MSEIDPEKIRGLVVELADKDGVKREKARLALVAIGSPAVPHLVRALSDSHEQVRWEAAKALEQIADSQAVGPLMKALLDKSFDVRWLAASALIAIGRPSLIPLLRELLENADSAWVREGAHHVIRGLLEEELEPVFRPVLTALEHVEPAIEVPLAARDALQKLAVES